PAQSLITPEKRFAGVFFAGLEGASTVGRISQQSLNLILKLLSGLSLRSTTSIAPIRTQPERTYDEATRDPGSVSPTGAHVPFTLARVLGDSTASDLQAPLLAALVTFGTESGMFKDLQIRRLGDEPSGPFQVLLRIGDKTVNLLDVGYGVSQV